jgi:hypothetical protein
MQEDFFRPSQDDAVSTGNSSVSNSSIGRTNLAPRQTSTAGVNNTRISTPTSFNFGVLAPLMYLILGTLAIALLVVIGLNLFRRWWWEKSKLEKWRNTVYLEISLPKETAEQAQKEKNNNSSRDNNGDLAPFEQLYAIMSEYAKSDFKTWLWGGENFSLELISVKQEVRFWLTCSKKTAPVIERQIISIYHKAHIVKLRKIDFFQENTTAYAQELKLMTRFELPFKTYKVLDSDPLNALTNALGGLKMEESAAIQIMITPIKNKKWHKLSQNLALQIQQGQNPKEILFPEYNFFKMFFKGLRSIIKVFTDNKKEEMTKKEEREIDLTGKKQQISLTPQQQDIIKKLEEKASKPGFRLTLRIVGSSTTEEKAKRIVENIIPSFQVFANRPSFNGFKKKDSKNVNKILENFIFRRPNLNQPDIINTEEINTLWHLPNHNVQTSNIHWLLAYKPPIPLNIPGPGPKNIYLGVAESQGIRKSVYLEQESKFRHIYSLGGSGSGKTVTMNNVILQDIKMGNGVCFVDPHGEGVDDILRRMPEERIKDVIVFSPSITDRPLGLNLLQTNPNKPEEKTLAINTMFEIWDKLYDLKKTGGPMFENYMKNAMRLVMAHPESGCTILEIPKVLVDEDFRSFKLAMCEDMETVDFWEKEATKAGGDASLENMVPYITSKLAPFIQNDFLRPMIGQQKSVINFREAMDNRKIILLSLSKGLIGKTSAYLLGMLMVGGLLNSGMGRADGMKYNEDGTFSPTIPEDRPPFFVYIDEMQNFLFDAIPEALEEIRKYKVGFYLAHQFVKQVVTDGSERIKDSLMANCGTKLIFRCGADDAKYLETEFAPLSIQDIQNPEGQTFNARLLVNKNDRTKPFNIKAIYDEYFEIEDKKHPEKMLAAQAKRQRILDMVKQKYGRDRAEIEKEIKDRAKLLF